MDGTNAAIDQLNALGAAGAIDSINIAAGGVDTDNIADGAITTTKIIDGAVTTSKIATGALDVRYYTQTQLLTSGQSHVHWNNLTNVPTFVAASELGNAAIKDGTLQTNLNADMVHGMTPGAANGLAILDSNSQIPSSNLANSNGIPFVTDTGNVNALVVTLNPAPTAYVDGLALCVKVATTSTGATTCNVNGLGAIPVYNSDGTVAGAGDLVAGIPVTFRYVGGSFFMLAGSGGLSGAGNATPAEVLETVTFTSQGGRDLTGTMKNNGPLNLNLSPGMNFVDANPGYWSSINIQATGVQYAFGQSASMPIATSMNLGSTTGNALQVTGLSFLPLLIYVRLVPVGSGATEYMDIRIYSAADNGFAYNGSSSYIPRDWFVKVSGSNTYQQQGFVGTPPTWYVYNGGFNVAVWDGGTYLWNAVG